ASIATTWDVLDSRCMVSLKVVPPDGSPGRRPAPGEYSAALVTVVSATVASPGRAAVPSRHGPAVLPQRERPQPQPRGEQSRARSGLQPGVVLPTTPPMQARIARCGPFSCAPGMAGPTRSA